MTIRILTQQKLWLDAMRAISGFEFMYHPLDTNADELSLICKKDRIDLILCFDFEKQYLACQNRQHYLDLRINWLLPKIEHARLEDKFFFDKWMRDNDLLKLLPAAKEIHEFPFVLKTGNSFSGSHVYYIKDKDELANLNFDHSSQDYICQEYIPGFDEYVLQFISIDGHITQHVAYKHIFPDTHKKNYIKGSRDGLNEKISKVVLNEDHLDTLTEIISDLKYTGCGCIDFKIFNDHLYIFEFNTRLGGSLIFHNKSMHDFSRFAHYLKSLSFINYY